MKRTPNTFSQLLLAGWLALGVGLIAVGITELAVVIIRPDGQPNSSPTDRLLIGYGDKGDPVLGHLVPTTDDSATLAYSDLAGNPIEETPWWAIDVPASTTPPAPWRDRLFSIGQQVYNGKTTGPWFLVPGSDSEPGAYFVEYSPATKEVTGFIGTAGRRQQTLPAEERFQHLVSAHHKWPHQEILLNCGTQVFLVDIVEADTRVLLSDLKTPLRGGIDDQLNRSVISRLPFAAAPYRSFSVENGPSNFGDFVLANDDSLFFISLGMPGLRQQEIKTQTFPLPPAARGRRFSFAQGPDNGLTVAIPEPGTFGANTIREQVYVLTEGSYGPPREFEVPVGPNEPRARYWACRLLLASPLAQAIESATSGTRSWHDYTAMTGPWDYACQLMWRDRSLILVASLVSGLLAVVCCWRQWRYRAPLGQRIVWPLFVFLLGFPGWIGYRYCRRWPELEACPTCHQPSPRTEETCAVCDREFPLPVVKGTEIFA